MRLEKTTYCYILPRSALLQLQCVNSDVNSNSIHIDVRNVVFEIYLGGFLLKYDQGKEKVGSYYRISVT